MAKLMRRMLVIAVAQAGLGSPGSPTAASNSIQTRTAMPKPIAMEYLQRNLVKAVKGNFGTIATGEHGMIEFETELAKSTAAGTAPPIKPLLLGAGFAETLVADTSAAYNLHSSAHTYLTLWCYVDGVVFKIEDAWTTVSAELNPKGIPVLKWRAMGKYVAPADATFPTDYDFSAFLKPLPVQKVNTPTFTVHGVAVKASAFSWDLGNQLEWSELINESEVNSNDRQPSARVTFELTSVSTKNWAETVRLNTEAAIQMIHGVGAGNQVQMDMPKAQFTADPDLTTVNNRVFLNGQLSLNPNAGNDELVLTWK
ncbi:hypothetical protein [Ramlibacter sp.]|uniref:hypothetical protein n=1 Tax=Ramlibacter sp. TaxID=1917967 RepID=UPI003D0CBA61